MADDTTQTTATRESLDAALAELPGSQTDPEYVVNGMRKFWGDIFTDADEAKIRELVKPVDLAAKAAAAAAAAAAAGAPPAKATRRARRQVQVTELNPATVSTVTTTEVQDDPSDALPAKVTLAAPYAFYDDDGSLRSWAQGRVVEDADEIALLVERGAIFLPD